MRHGLRALLPGQFGLRAIFVLTTMAAIGVAVIRLPIPAVVKIFALAALWIGFRVWRMIAVKTPASLTNRFNNAVLDIVGEVLVLGMFVWLACLRHRPLSNANFLFLGAMAMGPVLNIVRAVGKIRECKSGQMPLPGDPLFVGKLRSVMMFLMGVGMAVGPVVLQLGWLLIAAGILSGIVLIFLAAVFWLAALEFEQVRVDLQAMAQLQSQRQNNDQT
jgi:hypothetical protein